MDNTLGTLKACKHLALSSNAIDRIAGLKGMDSIKSLYVTFTLIHAAPAPSPPPNAPTSPRLCRPPRSMTLQFQIARPQPN